LGSSLIKGPFQQKSQASGKGAKKKERDSLYGTLISKGKKYRFAGLYSRGRGEVCRGLFVRTSCKSPGSPSTQIGAEEGGRGDCGVMRVK